jgi:diguanylate cyclase (GGDEF)-like protein
MSASGLNGRPELMSFMRIPQTDARLVIAVNEGAVLAKIDRDIHIAYLQFLILGLLVLIGAWFVGERLIVRPLRLMTNAATRFGRGDLSTRASHDGMPHEFAPLTDAFNAMATQLAERERDLLAANNRLTVLASTDVVSGLANRRSFETRLELEWRRATERRQPLGALMIDVDHFKLFNDQYGHPEGDACLRAIGDLLAAAAAETGGFATRYGGEEFLMLLPATDVEQATVIAERVCAMVSRLGIPHLGAEAGVVTVSIGSAALTPRPGEAAARLIGAADAGLYAAKRRGRNQVVAHGPIEVDEPAPEIVALDA